MQATPARRDKMPDRPSIAVLAFDNFYGGADQHMLGEGLSEDIITELARNRDLTVLARHTSFSVRGQGKTAGEIARQFDVRYLLEGSMRRLGDRLIVNAQLIDGHDSRHVWAERYEFGANDVYRSQGALCAKIAATLLAEMRQSEEAESLRRPPSNLDVYELTLRGMAHKHQFNKDAYVAGRAELSQAVALDPNFAPARIYRGYLDIIDVGLGISGSKGPADMAAGIDEIQRGIDLDPSLGVGYQALSLALGFSGLFEPQLRAAERSVALGPGDAENLAFLSYALSNAGRYAEALETIERAIEFNPKTPVYYMSFKSIALYALDRFEEAARAQTICADIQPGFPACYTIGAASEIAMGRMDSAAERIAKLMRIQPNATTSMPFLANSYPHDPQLRRFRDDGGDVDVIVIQSHGTVHCQGAAGHACPNIEGDALVSENTAIKRRACAESRGGADLPEHVAGLSSIDEKNRRTAGSRECAPNLENEDRTAVALRVQREYSRQLSRRAEGIDARREDECPEIQTT